MTGNFLQSATIFCTALVPELKGREGVTLPLNADMGSTCRRTCAGCCHMSDCLPVDISDAPVAASHHYYWLASIYTSSRPSPPLPLSSPLSPPSRERSLPSALPSRCSGHLSISTGSCASLFAIPADTFSISHFNLQPGCCVSHLHYPSAPCSAAFGAERKTILF